MKEIYAKPEVKIDEFSLREIMTTSMEDSAEDSAPSLEGSGESTVID